jgi:subtilisin family serine protease
MLAFALVLVLELALVNWVPRQLVSQVVRESNTSIKSRAVFRKPTKTLLTGKVTADVVVVKFREGTRIRDGGVQLIADLGNVSDADEARLQRANLSHQKVFQNLDQVNQLLWSNPKRHFKRLFTKAERQLDLDRQAAETRGQEELADLNLYYQILIEDANPRQTEQLIDQLNALDIVEIAYPQPIPEPAVDIAPATPDLSGGQGYLNAAPTGIDAKYAWTFPGGKGTDVRIIDIEQGFNAGHEDMPAAFFRAGKIKGGSLRQHGTAVLGLMAAMENTYGVTGIVPRATIGFSSVVGESCLLGVCWETHDVADAIYTAADQLRSGDLLLIEQHAKGPDLLDDALCSCNCSQFEYVPMEYWQANYDAIRHATSKGIIVVEAAGNGGMSLDATEYDGRFDRSVRDSGAILVGAGSSDDRAPRCFTNYGGRVDLQGWGQNVNTLGYGTLWMPSAPNAQDDRQWYSNSFSGTSSATPIVAGAAAAVQGFRKGRGLPIMGPLHMRGLLRSTGTAQASDSRKIGPLPNLRAAIAAQIPNKHVTVTLLSVKVKDDLFPSSSPTLAFNFTVNDQYRRYPGTGTETFPQGVSVSLSPGVSLATDLAPSGSMQVHIWTMLRPLVQFNPKTGTSTVLPRQIDVTRGYGVASNFGQGIHTETSTKDGGFFEVTYRIDVQLLFNSQPVLKVAPIVTTF